MEKYFSKSVLTGLLMTVCLGLSSCVKDNETDDRKGDNSIVGLWFFANVTYDIQHPNPAIRDAVEFQESLAGLASILLQGSSIEFKSDETWLFTVRAWGVSETYTGTYTYDGSHAAMSGNDEDSPILDGSSISIKGNILTIVGNGLDGEIGGDFSEYEGKTYREAGFTKCEAKLNFKK